jgi:hypothetical protein
MNYKKIFTPFILSFLCLFSAAHASTNNLLLHCLGKEEEKFHKAKITGPNYQLNQILINELTGLSGLKLRPKYYQSICVNNKNVSESLLQNMLLHGNKIYQISTSSYDKTPSYQLGTLIDIKKRLPHILLRYLSWLQSQTTYPKCLQEKLPHFKSFTERLHYLESDLPSSQVMLNAKKINQLFKKLKVITKVLEQCNHKQTKLNRIRLDKMKRNSK